MIVIRPGKDEVEAIQGIYDLVRFETERLKLRNRQLWGRRRVEELDEAQMQDAPGLGSGRSGLMARERGRAVAARAVGIAIR